jgi:ribose 5-phosphate isomerase RpiB
MLSKKTNTIALVSLLFALCSGGICSWVFYEIITSGQSLTDRVTTIADTRAKERAYKDLAKQVAKTEVQRTTLNSFVLTEEGTGAFLTQIEQLGVSQGVTLTTNSLKVVAQKDLPNVLQVQFSVVGKEQLVKKVLSILEALPYHSVISTLTLSKSAGGQAQALIDLSVTLFKHD